MTTGAEAPARSELNTPRKNYARRSTPGGSLAGVSQAGRYTQRERKNIMPRSREYRVGYGNGYNAAASKRWPEHRPPLPPEPVVRRLVAALQELRDVADSELATFSEDDELSLAFNEPIARADAALAAITQWLIKEPPSE